MSQVAHRRLKRIPRLSPWTRRTACAFNFKELRGLRSARHDGLDFRGSCQGRRGLRLGQMGRKGAGPGRLGGGARRRGKSRRMSRLGRAAACRPTGRYVSTPPQVVDSMHIV